MLSQLWAGATYWTHSFWMYRHRSLGSAVELPVKESQTKSERE